MINPSAIFNYTHRYKHKDRANSLSNYIVPVFNVIVYGLGGSRLRRNDKSWKRIGRFQPSLESVKFTC
jgi:hypothetical protein